MLADDTDGVTPIKGQRQLSRSGSACRVFTLQPTLKSSHVGVELHCHCLSLSHGVQMSLPFALTHPWSAAVLSLPLTHSLIDRVQLHSHCLLLIHGVQLHCHRLPFVHGVQLHCHCLKLSVILFKQGQLLQCDRMTEGFALRSKPHLSAKALSLTATWYCVDWWNVE